MNKYERERLEKEIGESFEAGANAAQMLVFTLSAGHEDLNIPSALVGAACRLLNCAHNADPKVQRSAMVSALRALHVDTESIEQGLKPPEEPNVN